MISTTTPQKSKSSAFLNVLSAILKRPKTQEEGDEEKPKEEKEEETHEPKEEPEEEEKEKPQIKEEPEREADIDLKKFHLVLDMDQTLVTTSHYSNEIRGTRAMITMWQYNPPCHVFFRPGVIEFLQNAFMQFGSVSIWTAAHESWLNQVLNLLDWQDFGISKRFAFTWHAKHGFKYLDRMYNSYEGQQLGMNSKNVFLVDDQINYGFTQKQSFIHITPYGHAAIGYPDEELSKIIPRIKQQIKINSSCRTTKTDS